MCRQSNGYFNIRRAVILAELIKQDNLEVFYMRVTSKVDVVYGTCYL